MKATKGRSEFEMRRFLAFWPAATLSAWSEPNNLQTGAQRRGEHHCLLNAQRLPILSADA